MLVGRRRNANMYLHGNGTHISYNLLLPLMILYWMLAIPSFGCRIYRTRANIRHSDSDSSLCTLDDEHTYVHTWRKTTLATLFSTMEWCASRHSNSYAYNVNFGAEKESARYQRRDAVRRYLQHSILELYLTFTQSYPKLPEQEFIENETEPRMYRHIVRCGATRYDMMWETTTCGTRFAHRKCRRIFRMNFIYSAGVWARMAVAANCHQKPFAWARWFSFDSRLVLAFTFSSNSYAVRL